MNKKASSVTSSDRRLERLMELVVLLRSTAVPMTAAQIYTQMRRQIRDCYPPEHVNFRRIFERDKEDLRKMGVPVKVKTVPATDPPEQGYIIRKQDYYLCDLTQQEYAALCVARGMVSLEGSEGKGAVLRRFGGEGGAGSWSASLQSPPTLLTLFQAVADRQLVRFEYDAGGCATSRRVVAERLDYVRGEWYLTGFDHLRDAERTFNLRFIQGEVEATRATSATGGRVAGVSEVGVSGAEAKPSAATALYIQPWEVPREEPVTAKLLVEAPMVGWATRQLGKEAIKQPSGAAIFDVRVGDPEEFFRFVGFFLEDAEILEPANLRQRYVERLGFVEQLGFAEQLGFGAQLADSSAAHKA